MTIIFLLTKLTLFLTATHKDLRDDNFKLQLKIVEAAITLIKVKYIRQNNIIVKNCSAVEKPGLQISRCKKTLVGYRLGNQLYICILNNKIPISV